MSGILKESGKVKAVRKDKTGFQLENKKWFGRSKEDLLINKGDQVDVTYTIDGIWNNIESVYVSSSESTESQENSSDGKLQIEVFEKVSLQELKRIYNEFAEKNNIKFSTPFQKGDGYDMIVYYN